MMLSICNNNLLSTALDHKTYHEIGQDCKFKNAACVVVQTINKLGIQKRKRSVLCGLVKEGFMKEFFLI